MRGILSASAVLVVAVALVAGAGCKTADPMPFNPQTLRAAESAGVTEQPAPILPPLPTTRQSPYLGPRHSTTQEAPPDTDPRTRGPQPRTASLRELIHLAVANAHDVRVAGYQPAIEETRVVEAEARFDPVFWTTLCSTFTWNRPRRYPWPGPVTCSVWPSVAGWTRAGMNPITPTSRKAMPRMRAK